jgi:AcrR family transcriptional regulator
MPTPRRTRTHAARPRWQRRKDARPEEIVAAALEEFVERGFNATRLDDVARRAGVTKGTIYLYFDGKEALFTAMIRQMLVPHIALGEQLVAEHTGSAADLLKAMIRKWWQLIGQTKAAGIPKLVIAEAGNFPELARVYHQEVVQRGSRLVAQVIERGIAAGEFRAVHVPSAVRLAWAPLVLAVILEHSLMKCVQETFNLERYLDLHIDTFLRGIARSPGGDSTHA